MAMEGNGLDQRANASWDFKLMVSTVCHERWHQMTACRHSHAWQQLISSFLPGVCAGLNRHMNSAFYLALQQPVFICVTLSFAQFVSLSSSTQIDAHAPYFSCLFQVRAWSATAPVIRVLSPYQRSRCIIGAGARLCLSVSARHARFITWRCSIFASHVSIFVVSLGREWAGRCYFVQWAVILGPWHQIPFL